MSAISLFEEKQVRRELESKSGKRISIPENYQSLPESKKRITRKKSDS